MDEDVVAVVAVIVVFALFICALAWAERARRRREEMLRSVAPSLGGTVVPGGFFHWQRSELHFTYRGHQAQVQYYSTGGKHAKHYTRFIVTLSSTPAFRVEVSPEGILAKVGKWGGLPDIQIGDPVLDDMFVIRGPDEQRIRAFLAPEVRSAIFQVCMTPLNRNLSIHADGTMLRIQKLKWIDEEDQLRLFISLCEKIVDGYLAAAAELPAQP